MRASEGIPTALELTDKDVAYLRHALHGNIHFRRIHGGIHEATVRRVAGLWALPSGKTLAVHPEKGTGADVFAWMCAVDPRLGAVLWQGMTRDGADLGDVASVMVRAFTNHLEQDIARAGPRRDYQRRAADTSVIRGRIHWAELARRGQPIPVPCHFWEHNVDTPLNRLFAMTLRAISSGVLLRTAGGAPLERLRELLGHVPPLAPDWIRDRTRPLSRLEAGFEAARSLALAILEHMGLAHGGGGRGLAFRVDLVRLFELTVEAAADRGEWDSRPRKQCRPPYEGDAGDANSRIDILVSTAGRELVIDAKYSKAFLKSHLYQVLAYMQMLGAKHGALVYPTGARLQSKVFKSAPGRPEWEVRVYEVDPIAVASNGRRELERLGEALKAGVSGTPEEAVA